MKDMVAAIDALILTGERRPEGVDALLKTLKPDTTMNASDADLARMVETVSLIRQRLGDYAKEAERKYPGFLNADGKMAGTIKFMDDEIMPDFTLADLKSERGRVIIHDAATPLNTFIATYLEPGVMMQNMLESDDETAKGHLDEPPFKRMVEGYHAELMRYFGLFTHLQNITREMPRKPKDFNWSVKTFLKDVPAGDAKVTYDMHDSELPVSTSFQLPPMLRQPLSNAIKAVRDSPVKEVNVSTGNARVGDLGEKQKRFFHGLGLSDGDEVAYYRVHDTGCGIPEEDLPHIFNEDFSRFAETGEGTGYGLAFVARMLPKFDGVSHVESKVGVGTTFTQYFKKAQ